MKTDFVDKAIIFAVKAHSGMVRKGTNIPYITHPLEALSIASALTDDQEVLAAAVLHDVVEDTPFTLEDIERKFGARVAHLAAGECENKREDLPAEDTWKIRKQETLTALENSTKEEQILVLADKLSNIRAMYRGIEELGEEFWQRFNQKDVKLHEWYYRGIAERLTKIEENLDVRDFNELIDLVFYDIPEMETVSVGLGSKAGYDYIGSHYKESPKPILAGMEDGDFPNEWKLFFEKWLSLAKKYSAMDDGLYCPLKSVKIVFAYKDKPYYIDYADLACEDYIFEYISGVIEEDLVLLGGAYVFYSGMID